MFASPIKTLVWLTLIINCSTWSPPAVAKSNHYYNNEYGISAVFPAGSRVCPALSGEHVRGFYAQYHSKALTCEEMRSNHEMAISGMSVYADYNANFVSPQANFDSYCKISGSKPALSSDELRRLSIKGHVARACSTKTPGGEIEITIITQNGTWSDSNDPHTVPYIFYLITLTTRVEHLRRDLAMFETFLHNLRISHREPTR